MPGNCQVAAARKGPRPGLSKYAAGHTDPHSALGIAALGGALAAKAAMQRHNIKGTIRFFGEPAEKLRLSKPVHAAKGYYDGNRRRDQLPPDLYAAALQHRALGHTHCGAAYLCIYSFECVEPEYWGSADASSPIPASHIAARAPGANDALFTMFSLTKQLQSSMLPFTTGWSISEAIWPRVRRPPTISRPMWRRSNTSGACPISAWRSRFCGCSTTMRKPRQRRAHCQWRRIWVSRSRPGLANHAMSKLVYENLKHAGAPSWGSEAIASAQAIQRELGLEPMEKPYLEAIERLIEPEEAERQLRRNLPPSQLHSTSDDYTEYCWHAPTARFYIGRPMLKAPRGFHYPDWVLNAWAAFRPASIR